jgi:hypothetical protein
MNFITNIVAGGLLVLSAGSPQTQHFDLGETGASTATVFTVQQDPDVKSVSITIDGTPHSIWGWENTHPNQGDTFSIDTIMFAFLLETRNNPETLGLLMTQSDPFVEDLDLFDGIVDFDGPSGSSHDIIYDTATITFFANPDIFRGTGTVDLVLQRGMPGGATINCGPSHEASFDFRSAVEVTIQYN